MEKNKLQQNEIERNRKLSKYDGLRIWDNPQNPIYISKNSHKKSNKK